MISSKKILASLILALAFGINTGVAQSHPKTWQEAKTISGNFKAVSSQPGFEVFSAPNVIMLKVNQETEVRIFTILGKLVSAQMLKPGIYEFHMESHGVYIIKTDEISCKLAI